MHGTPRGTDAPDPSGALRAAVARLDARIDWERMRDRSILRVSVEPARDLSRRLGDPAAGMRAVHVAGSKGKGSTAALIAAGIARAGRRVALYTSPHVESLRERLCLDGRPVDGDLFASAIDRALDAVEEAAGEAAGVGASAAPAAGATWFDVTTVAAFLAAREAGAEWLVAECGLGGRLDSTNVLAPELCAITSIELEHTEVLGDTRAKIAREKAGILKPGVAFVCGVPADDEAGRAIDERAAELGIEVLRPAWLARGASGARPSIEARNVALAGLALDALGALGARGHAGRPGGGERSDAAPLGARLLDPATVAAARLPGRLERFDRGDVPVVLDGAHVPSSVADVLADLARAPGLFGRPVVVLGLARNKDLPGILKALVGAVDSVVGTSLGGDLHRTPEEIAEAAGALRLPAGTAASPSDALDRATALARAGGGWVLVTGSLWLAGALRPQLRASEDPRP